MTPPQYDHTPWFAEEILPHEGALRGYLLGMLDEPDVEDVVQETYARILRMRERGPIESPRGLLFAMARNGMRDIYRRRATASTLPLAEIDMSRVFDDAPGVAETVSRRQEVDLLDAAIAALPPRCREILILRKFENLSYREIARQLGIAEHTVEAQLTTAIHRCVQYFKRRGAVPRK